MRDKMNFNNKRKSYSEILLQLTREQSYNFDNNPSCFLFDSRKQSLSTIMCPSEVKQNLNKRNNFNEQKITVKDLLKMGEEKEDFDDTLSLNCFDKILANNNNYLNMDAINFNKSKNQNNPSFISENTIDEFK